ncbi:MAG: single-stranded DNA-binding protein [Phycisphaerae bacterium]|nr:single-stranded DNA-binding protein [Phycisphaerae bacterium]
MAGSYNKVILLGNLTRDVEVRYTPNNQAVATIGLAVNRRYQGADGERKEETTFVDCEAWGKTAETMGKYLAKGRPVFIEGRLKLDTWKDKTDGSNRSKLKVVVENFQFVDSRASGAGGGGGGGGEPIPDEADGGGSAPQGRPVVRGPSKGAGAATGPNYQPIEDEDIPF